ncbi:putative lipoprotein, partial [Chlamydia psittaci 08-2626_L3]
FMFVSSMLCLYDSRVCLWNL